MAVQYAVRHSYFWISKKMRGESVNMKRNIQRWLSLLLVCAMVMGLFPARVMAKDERHLLSAKELIAAGYKPDQEIDIMVETDNTPAIEMRGGRSKVNDNAQVAKKQTAAKEEAIIEKAEEKSVDLTKTGDFSVLATGFSAKIKVKDIDKLHDLPGIKSIRQEMSFTRPTAQKSPEGAKPQMFTSKEQVHYKEAWDLGYKGDGMLIGVIDTGFDPDHRDWNAAAMKQLGDKNRYSEETMNAFLQKPENGFVQNGAVKGKWFNDKIVFGYNYSDKNLNIKDTSPIGDEHGQHVAGTIAAFGGQFKNPNGIDGVAPHAQILALKCFSNDKNTSVIFEHIWMEAMEDAVKLGADAINMSIGGTNSYMVDDQPMLTEQAFKNARDHGVLVVVSAMNDRNRQWGNQDHALAASPDVGIIGTPAHLPESFAAAAVENTHMVAKSVVYDGKSLLASSPYAEAGAKAQAIYVGVGTPQAYEENKITNDMVKGKIAVVDRGQISFGQKYENALERGAIGVIICDNKDSKVPMGMIGIDYRDGKPVVMITKKDGEALKNYLKANPTAVIEIPEGESPQNNPSGNQMAEFSSWGPTSDLRLKPDLAAPGGHIYSLQNDNQYCTMSGTSMAAPHITGGTAVVMQSLIARGIVARNSNDRDDLASVLMQNTADQLMDKEVAGVDNSMYTPRQQGAGMMNLGRAVQAPAMMYATGTNDTVKDGKLEIKEVKDQFTAHLEIVRLDKASAPITYRVKAILLEDQVKDGRYTEHALIKSEQDLGTITLSGDKIEKDFTVDVSQIKARNFVNGYLVLETGQDKERLSVPFLGFKGEGQDSWANMPFIDEMYDFNPAENNFRPIHHENGGVDKNAFTWQKEEGGWNYWNQKMVGGERTVFMNTNVPEKLVKANGNGVKGYLAPVLGILRNAEDVHFDIMDAQKNDVIRELHIENRIIKTNRLYQNEYNFLYNNPSTWWDGKINGTVTEGVYFYRITGHVNYPGADVQKYYYKVVLDNTAPNLEIVKVDKEARKITVKVSDALSGVGWIGIQDSRSNQFDEVFAPDVQKKDHVTEFEYTFTIPNTYDFDSGKLIAYAYDLSQNEATKEITEIPTQNLPAPTPSPEDAKKDLQAAVDEAHQLLNEIEKNPSAYDQAKVDALKKQVTIGEDLLKKTDATAKEMTDQAQEIRKAMEDLKPIAQNQLKREALQDKIDQAKDLLKHKDELIYPVGADAELENRIKAAENLLAKTNPAATDKELDDAIKSLDDQMKLFTPADKTEHQYPDITIKTPGYYQAFGKNAPKITVEGEVNNIAHIDRLVAYFIDEKPVIVNGVEQPVKGTPIYQAKYENPTNTSNGNISVPFEVKDMDLSALPDGMVYIRVLVEGTDTKGKKVQETVMRQIRKDTTAPTLTVKAEEPSKDSSYAILHVHVEENMNYVEVYMNGQMIHRVDRTYENLAPEKVTADFTQLVDLKEGDNVFTFVASDDGGNKCAPVKITIHRDKVTAEPLKDELKLKVKEAEKILNNLDAYQYPAYALPRLQKAHDQGLAVLNDPKATNADIKEAVKNLSDLMSLFKPVDKKDIDKAKEALQKEVNRAKDILNHPDLYRFPDQTKQELEKLVAVSEKALQEDRPVQQYLALADLLKDVIAKISIKDNNSGGPHYPGEKPTPPGVSDDTIASPSQPNKNKIDMERISGRDRIATAVELSKKLYDKADTVILVGYMASPDALAAAPLAALVKGPVLLTEKGTLSELTKEEIARLGAKNILVLSGKSQVSDAALKGLNAKRLSGENRYETAALIAKEVLARTGSDHAYVANGVSQADALTVAAVAAKEGAPILLTDGHSLTASTKAILDSLKNKVAIGGASSVGTEVYSFDKRIAGRDRYATAVAVAKEFFNSDKALLASGEVFVDALTAAPYAVKLNSPILLTTEKEMPTVVEEYIREKVKELFVIGGFSTINEAQFKDLVK